MTSKYSKQLLSDWLKPPSCDGLDIKQLVVLPGNAVRLHWTVSGFGWVTAETTGQLRTKAHRFFWGQTQLELTLPLGEELLIQHINPLGRAARRIKCKPNLEFAPAVPGFVVHSSQLQYQVKRNSYSIFGVVLSLDGLIKKIQHWRQHLNISSNWKVKTNLLQINYQNTAPIFDLPTFDFTFYKEIQAFNQTFTTLHHLTQGDKHEQ